MGACSSKQEPVSSGKRVSFSSRLRRISLKLSVHSAVGETVASEFEVSTNPSDAIHVQRVDDPTQTQKQIEKFKAPLQKRHNTVFARPLKDLSDTRFICPQYPKTAQISKFLYETLCQNFIFASLKTSECLLLIDAMMGETIPAGKVIIKQGDIGDFFYVIESGRVGVTVNGNAVRDGEFLNRGDSFGELALLYDCPRSATCTANTECHLWKVDQRTFRKILVSEAAADQRDVINVLRSVPFVSELDGEALSRIADALTEVTYKKGDRIIKKGDIGEEFYILLEGTVRVHDIGLRNSQRSSQFVDQRMDAGAWFGERALLTGDARNANITATSDCKCLCLSRETFEKTLGPLQRLIDRSMIKRALAGVPVFAGAKVQPNEMVCLANSMNDFEFSKGEKLAEQGKRMKRSIFVVSSGGVSVVNKNGLIQDLQKGDYFGEETLQVKAGTSLIDVGDYCLSDSTVTAKTDGSCCVLTKTDIERVIGSLARLGETPHKSKIATSMTLDKLHKIKVLGSGGYGKVFLVNDEVTRKWYALKMLKKQHLVNQNHVENIIREKNLMSSIEHPFVVNVVCSFQDESHIYLLEDFVSKGELYDVIYSDTRHGLLHAEAKFYAACVLEALRFLHERNVCYRDLKPENVLVDSDGYCRLADFGFAKIVPDKTYTFCGTPEYMAPEIILNKGHGKGVDFWALGVLVYEMLAGCCPFYSEDSTEIFKQILNGERPRPPESDVDEIALDLIDGLLTRRPVDRLGCLAGGSMEVGYHTWFRGIDRNELLSKKLSSPFLPDEKSALDKTHSYYQDSMRKLDSSARFKREEPLSPELQDLFREF